MNESFSMPLWRSTTRRRGGRLSSRRVDGNEQMLAAVEALLKSHEVAGSFLDVPVAV